MCCVGVEFRVGGSVFIGLGSRGSVILGVIFRGE